MDGRSLLSLPPYLSLHITRPLLPTDSNRLSTTSYWHLMLEVMEEDGERIQMTPFPSPPIILSSSPPPTFYSLPYPPYPSTLSGRLGREQV